MSHLIEESLSALPAHIVDGKLPALEGAIVLDGDLEIKIEFASFDDAKLAALSFWTYLEHVRLEHSLEQISKDKKITEDVVQDTRRYRTEVFNAKRVLESDHPSEEINDIEFRTVLRGNTLLFCSRDNFPLEVFGEIAEWINLQNFRR